MKIMVAVFAFGAIAAAVLSLAIAQIRWRKKGHKNFYW